MALTGRAKIAGVMGWPVGHTLSPRLHGFWLRKYGIDGAYIPLPVRPEDAADAIRMLPKLGFAGTNVTLPHKVTAMNTVDEVDPVARAIGSVNTIVCRPDGSLWGTSTDGFGFLESLRIELPNGVSPHGPAVVLGAGGASRAICAALIGAGASEVRIVNRTRERAQRVARDIGGPLIVLPWETREKALDDATLLVNATSLGMKGSPALEIALDRLPMDAVVCDLVYSPLQTPLLAAAARRGNAAVDGLEMLLHQARLGFSYWFGRDPEVDEDLREHVRSALRG